jgi:hypothetical protein
MPCWLRSLPTKKRESKEIDGEEGVKPPIKRVSSFKRIRAAENTFLLMCFAFGFPNHSSLKRLWCEFHCDQYAAGKARKRFVRTFVPTLVIISENTFLLIFVSSFFIITDE